MSSDSRGCRLLSDLNSAFRRDPDIDEYDFLPVLEPKHNRSPLILQDHKLGLEMWSVKILHQYAYHTVMTWRMKEANAKFLSPADLISLTRAIVLVNPDCSTAWNVRKELVESGDLLISDDLKLGLLVLGKHPKSPETFSHRKWLFQTLIDSCLTNSSGSTISNSSVCNNFVNMDAIDINLDPNVQNGYNVDHAGPASNQPEFKEHAFRELRICQKASEKYPSNYNSWSHRIWVLKQCFNCSIQVLFGELHTTENWISKHISDHSGFHYRQFLLTSLQRQSAELKEQFSVCYKNLIQKELNMIIDLIKCFEAHEALWYHRRFVFQNICQSYSAGTLVEHQPQDCFEDDIVLNNSQKKTKLENERQVLLLKEIDTVSKSDLTSKDKYQRNLAQKYIDWIQKFSRSLES